MASMEIGLENQHAHNATLNLSDRQCLPTLWAGVG